MTIDKGVPWGEVAVPPRGTTVFATCAELAAHLGPHLITASETLEHSREFVLRDASFRVLLGTTDVSGASMVRVPIDLLDVSFSRDGREERTVAVDSVVLGDRLLRDELTLVSNTGVWRRRRIAPRAHPNDGRADVVTVAVTMGIRQRLSAWRRTRWGTHLPHPAISIEQCRQFEWSGAPRPLTVDGVRKGSVTSLQVRVIPDALVVFV